jgi:hypothetical protein
VRRPSLKELARGVASRQPLSGDAAVRLALEAASLAEYRAALILGRLHLCGNCSRYTFASDPASAGACAIHGDGLLAFAMPFGCRDFAASTTPAAPEYLPDPDGARARRYAP